MDSDTTTRRNAGTTVTDSPAPDPSRTPEATAASRWELQAASGPVPRPVADEPKARYAELTGRTAVVTGAAQGIGLGIALRLASEGMQLIVADMDAEALGGTVETLCRHGVNVHARCADLSLDESIDGLFDAALERFGSVDVLVNNAANLRRTHLLDHPRELLDQQLATNVRSPYLCAQRAASIMRDAGGGSIVFISSVGGGRAHHRGLPYDATKGAIDAMTRAMAIDLGRYGIRVNAVAPGVTETYRWSAPGKARRLDALAAQVPLGRAGTVDDVASMVAFLASSESSYITGQVLFVDGGISAQLSAPGPNAL